MAQIRRLWLFAETSEKSYAGTNASLRLDIYLPEGEVSFDLGSESGIDLAQGKVHCQKVVLPQDATVEETQIREVSLRILSAHDAWLPKSIWIICETAGRDRSLLTADPDWHRWFDSDSRPGYSLTLLPRPQVVCGR